MVFERTLILATAAAVVVAAAVATVPAAADDDAGSGSGPANPDDIALQHLRAHAAELGVGEADVADALVMSSYVSSHTGVTHVNVNQRFRGLEVFGGSVTVNVTADGEVLHVGNSLVGELAAGVSVAVAALDAPGAVEAAAEALDLDEPEDVRVMTRGAPGRETVLSDGGISDEPITAKQGWQPTDDGLRLAWQLVIDDSSSPSLWNATVDAATGALLNVDDWTHYSTAENLSTLAGPPRGSLLMSATTSADPPGTTNPVDDGSSYRVFEIPKNDPNDGPRTLVNTPADATASPFGWHDVSGTPEPDYTITRGNNTHTYTDRDATNQPDPGSEAAGGPGLTFDFPADLDEHPQTYVDAAVTNLFYWCNIIHDIFHLYGFDEPSGNFQVNNYGRGGVGGDDVRCEAQDGSGHNNANFSTPAVDGGRPRMQMFLWPGFQFGLPNAVTVDAGPAAGTYEANYARFSPAPTTEGFSGELVLVDDGSADPTEGCDPLVGFPAGAVALVDRGSCPFVQKVHNAEAAGASAVVHRPPGRGSRGALPRPGPRGAAGDRRAR
jgi:hypothetical protein